MKRNLYLLVSLLLACGACKEELPGFAEEWYAVQFVFPEYNAVYNDKVLKSFTFYNKEEKVTEDTLWFTVRPQGALPERTRYLKFEQFPETRWDYSYDEFDNVVDSTLYKYPNQAEPGVHYVAFDDPRVAGMMKLEPGEMEVQVPVIVLRDPSMNDTEYTLCFKIVNSDDLFAGESRLCQAKIKMANCLIQPATWTEWFFVGKWGPERHGFMIRVTDQPWNDAFIATLTTEKKNYYLYVFNRELIKENEERAKQGLPPLREKPNDPTTEIAFPMKAYN